MSPMWAIPCYILTTTKKKKASHKPILRFGWLWLTDRILSLSLLGWGLRWCMRFLSSCLQRRRKKWKLVLHLNSIFCFLDGVNNILNSSWHRIGHYTFLSEVEVLAVRIHPFLTSWKLWTVDRRRTSTFRIVFRDLASKGKDVHCKTQDFGIAAGMRFLV